jgi:hypothetical protein
MDISQYAASADSIGTLSQYQINNFFRQHTSVTRNGCDQTAAEIIGCSVSVTPVQGVGSYTVAGGTKVVQFRHFELDLQVLNPARQSYGKFVPGCVAHGRLGDGYVYEMDLVPGIAFCQARRQLFSPEMEPRLMRTVQDFARYVDWSHI